MRRVRLEQHESTPQDFQVAPLDIQPFRGSQVISFQTQHIWSPTFQAWALWNISIACIKFHTSGLKLPTLDYLVIGFLHPSCGQLSVLECSLREMQGTCLSFGTNLRHLLAPLLSVVVWCINVHRCCLKTVVPTWHLFVYWRGPKPGWCAPLTNDPGKWCSF